MSNMLITELDLKKFKKVWCTNKIKHDINKCQFYHTDNDYIRDFVNIRYVAILCKNQINNQCKFNINCKLCHNAYEYFYHPENYKKFYCKQPNKCNNLEYCPDAHNEFELKVKAIHLMNMNFDFYINYFKTVPCPLKYKDHNKKNCVYYHNFLDIRRNINYHDYNLKNCNLWKFNSIKLYNEGCKKGINCKFSHGIFENFYHPKNYKKKVCNKSIHCKNKHCPFKHENDN